MPATFASAPTVKVLLFVKPPAIVKPVVTAVGVTPLMDLFVNDSVPVKVAKLLSSTDPFAFKNWEAVPSFLIIDPAVKFPPTIPAPLILKFELACSVVPLAIYKPLPAGKSSLVNVLNAGAASTPEIGPAKKVLAGAIATPVPP